MLLLSGLSVLPSPTKVSASCLEHSRKRVLKILSFYFCPMEMNTYKQGSLQ